MIPSVDVDLDYRFVLAGGLLLAGYLYLGKKALEKGAEVGGDVADAVGDALNITKGTNLAARAVAAIGEAVTGEEGWTPGGQVYGWTHDEEIEAADHGAAGEW